MAGYEWTDARRKAQSKRIRDTIKNHPEKWAANRAKFVATMKKRIAAKKKAAANGHAPASEHKAAKPNGHDLPGLVQSFPLDAIPERAPVRKYNKRPAVDDARVRLVLELVRLAQLVLTE